MVCPVSQRLLPLTEMQVDAVLAPFSSFTMSAMRPAHPVRVASSEIELCHCACWSLWE